MEKLNKSYVGMRDDLIEFIKGKNNIILDVGCATGINGEYLLNSDIAKEVYGIEIDSLMAKKASETYKKVFVGDLDSPVFVNEIYSESPIYNYIIFGDVLEHLRNPEIILKSMKSKIDIQGEIIVSLPNIAHIETFIQIYKNGRFPRNKRGIFDSTHARWFTKTDATKMLTECGYQVDQIVPKFRSRDALGSKFNWFYSLIKLLKPSLVTFQYAFVCSVKK